ncbi:MAG TPA: hypothetical protein VG013_09250 [Gemmataceae bacterium]|jgi:hypothetical protein|nr:hypothetical protein [Gemmataceae bacterium]
MPLERAVDKLPGRPDMAAEAAVLRARRDLAGREVGPARQLLEGVIAESAGAQLPRASLTHVLLQQGRDPAAAERPCATFQTWSLGRQRPAAPLTSSSASKH